MNEQYISDSMAAESSEEFTLARTLDAHYGPNKILLILLPIVFSGTFSWFFYTQNTITQAIIFAMIQSILVFLCWAIGRELDPDHDYAAFFGLPLLFLPFTIIKGSIFTLIWFLIGLRLINQSTGKKISSSDVTLFILLSIIAAIFSTHLLLLPLAIIFILLAASLPKKQVNLSILLIPLIPSFILLVFIFPDVWILLNPSPLILIYIAISCALMFLVTITTDEIICKGDHSYTPLSLKRVQSAQIIAVLSVLMISTFHGNILTVFPIWAALTGVGVYRLIHLVLKK